MAAKRKTIPADPCGWLSDDDIVKATISSKIPARSVNGVGRSATPTLKVYTPNNIHTHIKNPKWPTGTTAVVIPFNTTGGTGAHWVALFIIVDPKRWGNAYFYDSLWDGKMNDSVSVCT
jgi:hypothetical protein